MIQAFVAILLLVLSVMTADAAPTDRRIDAGRLLEFSKQVLSGAGADLESAEATSQAMLHASLHGVDSHGIRLLPFYAKSLETGLARKRPTITVQAKRRAAVVVDADGGLGHLPLYRAMDEACTLARDCGIGMATVVNSTHFGAAGAYSLAAANAGFIGFVAGNCGAFVVPHGGSLPAHGTNPISLAAPREDGDPFLLDMATSSIPWNRVLRSRLEGIELPPNTALDQDGAFTRSAEAAAVLAPLGGAEFGYKGAGLAGMAEILGGVLTGMRLSIEQDGRALGDSQMGQFVMAIDPTLFQTMAQFTEGMGVYLDSFNREPETMPAGGPQWRARRDRERDGIPLSPGLQAELEAAGQAYGVSLPLS